MAFHGVWHLASHSTTLFTKQARFTLADEHVAVAHLVCYGHFSPGCQLFSLEFSEEASCTITLHYCNVMVQEVQEYHSC